METGQETDQEPETADLSGNPKPSVEPGAEPDETDVTQLLQSAIVGTTSHSREPRETDRWSGWPTGLNPERKGEPGQSDARIYALEGETNQAYPHSKRQRQTQAIRDSNHHRPRRTGNREERIRTKPGGAL